MSFFNLFFFAQKFCIFKALCHSKLIILSFDRVVDANREPIND